MASRQPFTASAHCKAIVSILRPTMRSAPADGTMVMFARRTVELIYEHARKGARAIPTRRR